jgi:hypothetical protein
MGVATRVTMRVVVTTPLTATLSLASEPEPLPLSGTLTGMLLWSSMSVMGLTRLSAWWKGSDDLSDGWMTLHTCKPGLQTRVGIIASDLDSWVTCCDRQN